MGFSRQEYWGGLPFPAPGDLPDPRIEPRSHAWQADSLPLSHQGGIFLTLYAMPLIDTVNLNSPKSTNLLLTHTLLMDTCLVTLKSLQLCQLCSTLWTVARQAPLSIGVSRQEY